MEFEIEESFPQTAHVILKTAQEKADFIEALGKLGAENLMAITTEKEEEQVSTATEAMRVLVSIRKNPKCNHADICKDTGMGAELVSEKLDTLLKAGKIKQRMKAGVAHYKSTGKKHR